MNSSEYDLEKLKAYEIKILDEVVNICKENNIKYFLAYGTLLGAIRHKGFIPWDDDIDIYMSGEDYYKFKKIMLSKNDDNYFYQCLDSDKYYSLYFNKMRLNNTLAVEKKQKDEPINKGIFIDIFPMVPFPKNEKDNKLLKKKYKFINLLIEADLKDKTKYNNYGSCGKIISKLCKIIPRKFRNNLANKLLKTIILYNKEYEYYIDLMGNSIYEKKSFLETVEVSFEGKKYNSPKQYDRYLTSIYGDYMKLPSKKDRKNHKFVCVSFNCKEDMKVDFVIPWVDGNDPKWQEEKSKYDSKKKVIGVNSQVRYRDWDNLKYLFRGIEKYAPWVNNIYFITWGHLPNWLDTNNPKLKIINHKDYIPKKYLPTFSSNPIELNIFRIKDLSQHFVLFNDDMFLTNYCKKEDFFVNGIPCDNYNEVNLDLSVEEETFAGMMRNNYKIVNKYYNKYDILKKNPKLYFNFKYGLKRNLQNIKTTLTYKKFVGINNNHIPQPFLKSYFEKLWDLEYKKFDSTSLNKFRTKNDVTEWVIRYFQLLDGNFIPRNFKLGKYFAVGKDNTKLIETIKKQKYKFVCINDSDKNVDFEKCKKEINDSFDTILGDKSSFEK